MFKKLLVEQKGQSLVLTAIFLAVLIGFAGLAIDGGRLYLAKSQLQKAVDAGVLAGADALLDNKKTSTVFDHSIAVGKAETIAINNYNNDNVSYIAKSELDSGKKVNYVQVNGEEDVTLLLMPVLGIKNTTVVSAVARVDIGEIVKANKGAIIPIGVNGNELCKKLKAGDLTFQLIEESGDADKGNFNFLDFSSLEPGSKPPQKEPVPVADSGDCGEEEEEDTSDGDKHNGGGKGSGKGGGNGGGNGGAAAVGDYIENGSPAPMEVGQLIETKTGVPIKSNTILPKIKAKIGTIVYIPIISEFGSGKSTVMILGFAAFEILSLSDDEKTINARFIEKIVPGEIGDVPIEYIPIVSKLIL
ncbi:Tad domain-containing protein [Neobacillus niacini]|uniref:Tad domain-containing protein n=1 Tax=Neobacillus niacini TaxID=86668 RepID=UPI0005EF5117|nr:Tad domain-containing protein [Neobacillus niacini]